MYPCSLPWVTAPALVDTGGGSPRQDFGSSLPCGPNFVEKLTTLNLVQLAHLGTYSHLGTYNAQEATPSCPVEASQMQHDGFQCEPPFCDIGPSRCFNHPNVPECCDARLAGNFMGDNEGVGEKRGENVGAPRVRIEFKMFRPEPSNEKPIELRRENQVVISVLIITEPDKANIPWKYIRVLNIGPAGHYRFRCGPASLDFALEVHGATTGRAFVSACNKCSAKDPPASCNLSLLDFTAKNGLVGITSGTARVAFRFRCLPRHHNTSDTEYRLSAIVSAGGRILGRHTFTNWLRVVHHLRRRKNTPSTAPPQAIETSSLVKTSGDSVENHDTPPNARVSDQTPLGTSTGDSRCSMPVQPSRTHAQSPLSDPVAPIPRANEEPEPEREGSGLPASSFRNDTGVHEKLPVLSHMNPRRGSTKGGYEIYLVVRNLPPTALLYARFGCNLAPTSHIAPGVLSCILPAATRPGAVDVTLCEAPSVDEKGYGKSLVSFEYESDTPAALLTSWWNDLDGNDTINPGFLQRNVTMPSSPDQERLLNSQ